MPKARPTWVRQDFITLCDILLTVMYLDVKPDNVFLNWTIDDQRQFHLTEVVLGDMVSGTKLGELVLDATVGHRLWRSPEMHIGKGVGIKTDVFSFDLLVRCLSDSSSETLITNNSLSHYS